MPTERLIHIKTVCWATLLETVRRKDLYVVWILAVAGMMGGLALSKVGVRGIETFLRDITLSVVNVLSLAICIWLAARQMPEELSRRTLFPLLARPVRRVDVLTGKLLAVWILSGIALATLGATAWVTLAASKATLGPIYWQYLALRMLSFGPIAALTMAVSLILTPPATVLISALVTFFGAGVTRSLAEWISAANGPLAMAAKGLYFVLPHLDLFDLSSRAAYNYPPIGLWALGALSLYAVAYVLVFLGLGELRFRKMAV